MFLRLSRAKGLPRRLTVPESGMVMPTIMRMLEVLPAPLGPRRPNIVPASMRRLKSLTAILFSYDFEMWSSSTTAAMKKRSLETMSV